MIVNDRLVIRRRIENSKKRSHNGGDEIEGWTVKDGEINSFFFLEIYSFSKF